MGFTDYSHVNMDTSSSEYLQPTSEGSWRNRLIERTDVFFTIAFAVECGLKIVAMGYFKDQKTWNAERMKQLKKTVHTTGIARPAAARGAWRCGLRVCGISRCGAIVLGGRTPVPPSSKS